MSNPRSEPAGGTWHLAGCRLTSLERRGNLLLVGLERGGRRLTLELLGGAAAGTLATLPAELTSGHLLTAAGTQHGAIPLDDPPTGALEIHLSDAEGGELVIVGQGLRVAQHRGLRVV